MQKIVKIAIDAMGGEDAPKKNISGLKIFIDNNKSSDYFFNIYGDEKLIKIEIQKQKISDKFYKIIHTTTSVSDDETPIKAIKNSKNSSMWKTISSQVDFDSDISLSAGNTGVLLVISKMILKTIDNVSKPALAALWPSKNGMSVVLDLGANVECDEVNLLEFSEMGSALYKSLFPNNMPKVSLLNIGSEEIKGTDILKKANEKLKTLSGKDFSYTGYIEGNKITDGHTNVIVTDGFTGNIALKTAEGTASFITDQLKKSFSKNLITKLSMLLSYFSIKEFKSKLDPRKYNGAIFLGLNGPVVKSHGSIDSVVFYHSIDLCYKIIQGDLMNKIKNNLSHINDTNKKL